MDSTLKAECGSGRERTLDPADEGVVDRNQVVQHARHEHCLFRFGKYLGKELPDSVGRHADLESKRGSVGGELGKEAFVRAPRVDGSEQVAAYVGDDPRQWWCSDIGHRSIMHERTRETEEPLSQDAGPRKRPNDEANSRKACRRPAFIFDRRALAALRAAASGTSNTCSSGGVRPMWVGTVLGMTGANATSTCLMASRWCPRRKREDWETCSQSTCAVGMQSRTRRGHEPPFCDFCVFCARYRGFTSKRGLGGRPFPKWGTLTSRR